MEKHYKLKALGHIAKNAQAHARTPMQLEYLRGFCKTAREHGIDPVMLMKEADGFWSELGDQLTSDKTLKNFGTGFGRALTGVGQGLASVASGIGGAIGATASGLTGNGWGNGWDAGTNFVDNLGFGSLDIGAAKRRMSAWQHKMRDDYLERNDIDLAHPESLNWADKLALFGSDLSETAGKGIGTTVGINGIAGLTGRVGNTATEAFGMKGDLGRFGTLVTEGTIFGDALNSQGNYNRQTQDLYRPGFKPIKPGNMSHKIKYTM